MSFDDTHAIPKVIWRAQGVLLLIGALGVGGMSWVALTFLAGSLQQNPEVAAELPDFVRSCLGGRNGVPLLILPAAISAIVLASRSLRPALAWLLLLFASLWVSGCFSLVLYTFISVMAPLYQYHPL